MNILSFSLLIVLGAASLIPEAIQMANRGLPSHDPDDVDQATFDRYTTESGSSIKILSPFCFHYCMNPGKDRFKYIGDVDFDGKQHIQSCYTLGSISTRLNSIIQCCSTNCERYAAKAND